MKPEDIENAFIAYLSGIAKMKNEREIYCDNQYYKCTITIELPTLSPKKAIVRWFWDNGNVRWKNSYKNGLIHGICYGYFENGKLYYKGYYEDGKFIKCVYKPQK